MRFWQNCNVAMNVLGLGKITETEAPNAKNHIKPSNSVVEYNGVEFSSGTNTLTVNGLTIQANQVSNETIRVNVANDTDGVYDFVKGFVKEYNENAKIAKAYQDTSFIVK